MNTGIFVSYASVRVHSECGPYIRDAQGMYVPERVSTTRRADLVPRSSHLDTPPQPPKHALLELDASQESSLPAHTRPDALCLVSANSAPWPVSTTHAPARVTKTRVRAGRPRRSPPTSPSILRVAHSDLPRVSPREQLPVPGLALVLVLSRAPRSERHQRSASQPPFAPSVCRERGPELLTHSTARRPGSAQT